MEVDDEQATQNKKKKFNCPDCGWEFEVSTSEPFPDWMWFSVGYCKQCDEGKVFSRPPYHLEPIDHVVYDTITIRPYKAISNYFFRTPFGMDGKTYLDTNMSLCGHIPPPRSFEISSVWVSISEEDFEDHSEFRDVIEKMQEATFSVQVGDKTVYENILKNTSSKVVRYLGKEECKWCENLTLTEKIHPMQFFTAKIEYLSRYKPIRVAAALRGTLWREVHEDDNQE